MKCESIQKILIFYVEGDLPEKQMNAVSEHLGHCSECAAFAEVLKEFYHTVLVEKSALVSPYFSTRLKTRVFREQQVTENDFVPVFWTGILRPALLAALLIIGVVYGFYTGKMAGQMHLYNKQPESVVIPILNEMNAEPIETFLME